MSAISRLQLNITSDSPSICSNNQKQTESTFSYKWAKKNTYNSPQFQAMTQEWLIERYCNHDNHILDTWLQGEEKIILDAGCGSGHSALLFFGERLNRHHYLGVDISDAINIAIKQFQEKNITGEFLKKNIMELKVPDSSVDIIFSEGVLHHTDSTEKSIKHLAKMLRPGGLFLFYIYRKKSPIREFTDDYIRNHLSQYSHEQAWEALKPLTKLGEQLGKMAVKIDIPEDIPFLGINKGEMDLQRFFYWHICKLFYRDNFNLEEMNHINFDWFRPMNCSRHTPEEIEKWCKENQLKINRMMLQDSGITIVASKE